MANKNFAIAGTNLTGYPVSLRSPLGADGGVKHCAQPLSCIAIAGEPDGQRVLSA